MENEGYSTGLATGMLASNGNGGIGNWNDLAALLIVAGLFGWGGGGFGGGFGGGRGGAIDGYILNTDMAQIDNKIDRLANGLCDGFYTQAQLVNGINTNIMQGNNAIQAQLADCCCTTQRAIDGINFANANNTRDIIENQNAGTRAILEKMCQYEIEAKNAKIAEQNQRIGALELAASQAAQNAYLIGQLRPAPTPSYVVPNPYCNCGYNGGVYGTGYGV